MGILTPLAILLPLLLISALVYRIIRITNPKRSKPLRYGSRNLNEPTHLLIVLGSGGHTAEMLAMLTRAVQDPDAGARLNWRCYTHRTWVTSSGDMISAQRAKEFEEMVATLGSQENVKTGKTKRATDTGPGTWECVVVPRAREIHQPTYTAPLSSLRCMRACWDVLRKHSTETRDGHAGKPWDIDFPDIILCNGPATATIMVFTSILMRFFDVKGCSTRAKMRTIYVESWARVKRLSLSGRLLKFLVDRFLVQWPQLERVAGGRAEFVGVLV